MVVGCYLFVYVNLLLCTCVYVANLYMFSIQVFRLYNLLVWLETNPHFVGGTGYVYAWSGTHSISANGGSQAT